ncbi:MAG TPA: bifunctional 2-polyprenyl-6-hydroxyphenol methylase/3-demethylubiquinol 3-O-methyltransferase UbiG [Alphaproteobacteria bacterium]|jgi:2-polyprenyl-6-hydroxyphenyl methylase/3-demethylubiquinone-9 3-methyltransferase
MSTSINPKEIEHFSKDSARWWDEGGPFAILHRLNPVRLRYVRDQIGQHYGLAEGDLKAFKGLKILDIGCGGGLVCEPLARLGADVTGIDADGQAVRVAREHAEKSGLDIQYIEGSAESCKGKFDVVTALEIVEHVNDVETFVKSAAGLCKPGGLVIFSTLNRTPQSFLLGIVAAEHILRWVPRGTHDWKKFVRPSELAAALRAGGMTPGDITGYGFDVRTGEFRLTNKDIAVNYFMCAEKKK